MPSPTPGPEAGPAISAVMLTLNEAHLINDALESLSFADEVVVVDLGSVDGTREAAERRGARVIERPNHPCLTVNFNEGFSEAQGDWLYLTAPDERPSPELIDEMRQAAAGAEHDAYRMPRRNHVFGRWLKHGGNYPDTQLRLVRRGKGRFPEKHQDELMDVTGSIGQLTGAIDHFTEPDLPHMVEKTRYYAEFLSDFEIDRGVRVTPVNAAWFLAVKPAAWFCYKYLWKRSFLDGMPGLIYSGMNAFSVFLKYARVWDKQRGAAEATPFGRPKEGGEGAPGASPKEG